jgi:hypothetical protein
VLETPSLSSTYRAGYSELQFPEAPTLGEDSWPALALESTLPIASPWSDEKYSRMVGESEKSWGKSENVYCGVGGRASLCKDPRLCPFILLIRAA